MNSASLNQIAFNVLNILRGGRSSHNEHISLEQIKFNIKYYRSLFIRRDQERNANRFRMFEQDLGMVPVETVDSAEDDNLTSGNILVKTSDRIPTPIRLKTSEAITYIGNADKAAQPIPLIDAHRVIWNEYNKYTSAEAFAYYRDGYIYISNDISIENLNIRGIFEDPEQVVEFTNSNDLDLYDSNSPFPIPTDMLEGITKGIVKGELTLMLQTPNDVEVGPIQDGKLEE